MTNSAEDRLKGWEKLLNRISGIIILLNVILIGIESSIRGNLTADWVFTVLDIVFVGYFTFEIGFRIFNLRPAVSELKSSVYKLLDHYRVSNMLDDEERRKNSSHILNENVKDAKIEVIEKWVWLLFDTLLVLGSWIAFAKHFVTHPELIMLLRILRILRIFRIFSISDYIKNIEKKIAAVIPTISIFLLLIFLLVYTYAILGMNLYNFHRFENLDFSNLYEAMLNLFMLMTNGWSGILNELRAYDAINPLITDFYVISFFIFSVMITLNVFLAVMTSGIQDRLAKEKNQKPQSPMPENSDLQQEIASLKQSIETLREALERKKD
ncbi:MAG: ion transporter [Bacteroidota bacterium]